MLADCANAREQTKKLCNQTDETNFINKMNIDSIERISTDLKKLNTREYDFKKRIAETQKDWGTGDGSTKSELIRQLEHKMKENSIARSQILKELNTNIAKSKAYADLMYNQSLGDADGSKNLEGLKDIKKNSMFGLEELLNKFESLDGISKLAFSLAFNSSVILGCLFSIILNLYGNYLLDRFKLEERFPKIARIINYRRKLSKYYIISNFLLIISMCLINIIFGVAILSL